MSRRLDQLAQAPQEAAKKALAELEKQGDAVFVDSTRRLDAEQVSLYAQGREPLAVVNALRAAVGFYPLTEEENKRIVTNCDGVKIRSAHQDGRALDVVPAVNGKPVWPVASDPRWRKIAAAFTAQGFTWGGDWDGDGKTRSDGDLDEKFIDYPHYEWRKK
jgi:hypothetical protein